MKQAGTEITFYRDKTQAATMTCLWSNDFNFFEERQRPLDRFDNIA